MKVKEARIIDTTLRDGEQSAGLAFSVDDKVMVAGWLDEAGISQIEAGIPALGPSEIEAITRIIANRKQARISTWNRLNEKDIRLSMACRPDIIHLSAPVSYAQIYVKLRRNKVWLFNQLKACTSFAREHGYTVTVGFEDASRADIGFLISLGLMLRDLQVGMVRYADTVGVCHPSKIMGDVRTLLAETGLEIEIHTHNDLGMAAANSVAAAMAGAVAIDCTLGGIGERTGNCGLSEFLRAADGQFECGIGRRQAACLEERFLPLVAR